MKPKPNPNPNPESPQKKTCVVKYSGRRGEIQYIDRGITRFPELRIEPFAGLYYIFHGLGLPLFTEAVVGEYREFRARCDKSEFMRATRTWREIGHLWHPVIDLAHDLEILDISFELSRGKIGWNWRIPGFDKQVKGRAAQLGDCFEELGKQLRMADQVHGAVIVPPQQRH